MSRPDPASACPDENVLARLSEGAIEGAERLAIEHHLDGCASCTRLVGELATLVAPARSAPQRYRVLRQLGEGAMGVVWEAEDTHLQRRVALKFVRPEGVGDPERRTRLVREARALAQLRHPNVVSVYDAGELASDDAGTELFLALELVVGTDARTWRDAAPRNSDEILAVWNQAAAGIAAVHRAGIVHRDIKPDNVLVSEDGRVLVGDFGLATGELGAVTTTLTMAGAMVGTPLYMSPEQLNGDPATAKSDQFALCTSIWEALVGQRPFAGATIGALAIAMTRPLALPRTGDRAVFGVLARGLDPDPDRRYPGVEALLAALARPVAPRRARIGLGLGALALGAVAIVAGVAVSRPGTPPEPAAPGPATTVAALTLATPSTAPEARRADRSLATPDAGSAAVAPGQGAIRSAPPRPAVVAPPRTTQLTTNPTAPIPVQPSPPVVPPVQAGWAQALTLATDKLQVGDGAGCLQVLATIPPVPANQLELAELTRLSCRMAAGDCVAAASELEAYGRAHGWAADKTRTAVESTDAMHCPIAAAPSARRVTRARTRLMMAASAKRSCRPVLATMQQLGLQLADPREQLGLEAACAVNAGDCAAAKAKYRKFLVFGTTDPQQLAALDQRVDEMFARAFKTCP